MKTLKLGRLTRVHWWVLSLLLVGTAVLCTTQTGRQWVRHRVEALSVFLPKAQTAAMMLTAPTAETSAVAFRAGKGAHAAANFVEDQSGVWRFRGLAGKCLDTGAYPLGHNGPVLLYDCNGTAAQDITAVPVGPDKTDYELRAHNRCLTVEDGIYQVGRSIVLTPCDRSLGQRFKLALSGFARDGYIIASATTAGSLDSFLSVTARDGNTANRTPLVLEPFQNPDSAQRWTALQFDTTAYDWAPTVATAGAYEFKGFEGKCIDIGGTTHPEHSPAFLYNCNGTLAQFFAIKPVDDHLGYYNLTAFGRCLDIGGGTPSAGAPIELNACSGAPSQRFAFDNFDRRYIYPAGTPELVIGVRATGFSVGMSAAAVIGGGGVRIEPRPPMLDLQTRAAVDAQNWQPIAVEHTDVGPKAPDIHFDKMLVRDHRNGQTVESYKPALDVRDNAALNVAYEILWKPLGEGDYTRQWVSGNSAGTGKILSALLSEIYGGVHVAKARATADNGLFSESPEIIIDGRLPPAPSVWIDNVQTDEVTVNWRSAGAPKVNDFLVDVFLYPVGSTNRIEIKVGAKPSTGTANLLYQQRVTGLQPNSKYGVYVNVQSDLWGGIGSQETSVTTLSSSENKGPFTTTIWMARQEIVQGYPPYVGTFGPIYDTGAIITKINFPTQYPPVLLVKPGHSTEECGDPNAVIQVWGDMTADQKKAIWGTANLSISGLQVLNFVGCTTTGPTEPLPNLLPVNITWRRP